MFIELWPYDEKSIALVDKGPNHNQKQAYNKHLPKHAAISDR